MLDQAQKLRQLVEQQKKDNIEEKDNNVEPKENISKPRIITVTSGKGGVGKSNFVVNLSIALQKIGKKVLIFDADMGLGNDDVLMGFLPKYNVYDVIFGGKKIEDVLVEGPFGVKLLPGGTGISRIEQMTDKQRDDFLDKLSYLEDLDYIIMDTGAGVNRDVLGFISCCEELILITTPEPTSLTDAYSLLKAVSHFKIRQDAKVIVNRVMDANEGENTFNKFNSAVKKFLNVELQYLGQLTDDKKLIQAVRKQQPFLISYPNSDVARDIDYIASKIIGLEVEKKGNGVQDFFKKIFNIFS
ncbi:MinD/ParA family protein [Clostridium thailandense]|uniref:MinD/ParA family protein n=1 Tax=Clostridium thailandense TaxID=2794346 RepID=A0A949TWF7_9CLOT|nr:MinD/ParA family protein [Clostridium thailandense]MBV7272203.1 MinD/ParA family protein [Clostridium thailandense]MCH5136512.1 MinD/ParA family protein [Clostridiaceae bacterium UIB06]